MGKSGNAGPGTIAGTYGSGASGASGGSGQTRNAKGPKPIIADNPKGKYKGYTPGGDGGNGVRDPRSPRR